VRLVAGAGLSAGGELAAMAGIADMANFLGARSITGRALFGQIYSIMDPE
jgi:hypothetical protein